MTDEERSRDIMRQGFMKPLKVKPVKAKPEIVACNKCLNWHPKGKHIKAQVDAR